MYDDEDFPEPDLPDDSDISWDEAALADRDDGVEELGIQIINWRTIDPDSATEALHELSEWVHWIVARYNVPPQKIPDCWAEHGDLVEELSALHTAWLVAYDETDGGYGPIGWQERFGAALTRSTFKERCSAGHNPVRPRTMTD